jgi:hypothetical protein
MSARDRLRQYPTALVGYYAGGPWRKCNTPVPETPPTRRRFHYSGEAGGRAFHMVTERCGDRAFERTAGLTRNLTKAFRRTAAGELAKGRETI